MLEVKNISVSYGHVDALHDVNIVVETGKIVSVIGANGAGKTSLVNTISGLVKPLAGEIYLNGELLPKPPTRSWPRVWCRCPRAARSSRVCPCRRT